MIPQGDLDAVKARGREVYETHVRLRKSGANYVGLCPFHDEKTPSFTVFPDGGFKCFGCGQHGDAFDFVGDLYNLPTFAERAQLAADYAGVTLSGTGSVQRVQRKPAAPKPKPDELGVWKTDIPPKGSASSKPKLVATYRYVDEDGELLFEKLRFEPGPDGKGGWTYELDDVRKPLFNLPQVLRAEGVVLFVEGEKDVEAAEKLGFVATTVATKKRDWLDEWSKSLARKDVAILPDNDQPGREFAQWALAGIEGTASKARIVELPGLPEKGDDLTDWVSNGGTRDELLKLISESREPGELTYRQLSKVEAQPVNFLWEGRFARGKVSIVAGNPGLGKSQVAISFGRRFRAADNSRTAVPATWGTS